MRDVLDCFRGDEPEPPPSVVDRMLVWLAFIILSIISLFLFCA